MAKVDPQAPSAQIVEANLRPCDSTFCEHMSEKIQVDLDELMELFLFLEDLNHFFHSPTKYSDQETVIAYVEGEMYDKLKCRARK